MNAQRWHHRAKSQSWMVREIEDEIEDTHF